jgi:hypothetical protein
VGESTGVNIWDKVISAKEIFKCQGGATGNVKSWPNFISGLKGNVKITKATW